MFNLIEIRVSNNFVAWSNRISNVIVSFKYLTNEPFPDSIFTFTHTTAHKSSLLYYTKHPKWEK